MEEKQLRGDAESCDVQDVDELRFGVSVVSGKDFRVLHQVGNVVFGEDFESSVNVSLRMGVIFEFGHDAHPIAGAFEGEEQVWFAGVDVDDGAVGGYKSEGLHCVGR